MTQIINVNEIKDIIDIQASTYDVDWQWIEAIISTESSWNPYTLKYEPNYPYLFKTEECAKAANVTLATEIASQKMSWGLGQIMGALAREQGHRGSMGELCKPEVNIQHLAIRLKYLKHLSSDPSTIFAGYNGGPGAMTKMKNGNYMNQKYVNTVNSFLVKLI